MQEQEVKFKEYVNILLKKKNMILAISVVLVALSVAISLLLPKIYEVSIIVKPGIISNTIAKGIIPIDTPKNITTRIETGVITYSIRDKLNLDPKTDLKFDVIQPKDSDIIKIRMYERQDKTDTALKVLNQLFVELSNMYKKDIELVQGNIDKEIDIAKDMIAKREKEIKLKAEGLDILKKRQANLASEIENLKKNTDKLIAEKEALLCKNNGTNEVSTLLYTNAIQQNMAFMDNFNKSLIDLVGIENSSKTINDINAEIADINLMIGRLNLAKAQVCNIELLREPRVSTIPISPKKTRIVLVTVVLSIMLGIALVLFQEYWNK
ncbi:MAG: hypothetical protein JW946_00355 [Candidatus Omnitrophica bacterium]|nr:hypothetical protein [Candidatus Omnitrophota bacterium]